MSRFNTKDKTLGVNRTKTVNRAGGEAFKQSDKLALISQLLTSFVNDQFYRSADQGVSDLMYLLGKVDPKFAAKAALFARNEFGMRSVTHLVAANIAETVKGEEWTKSFFSKIIHRPDDMLEILSLVQKPVPNSVKKGFANVLSTYNEYTLGKYQGKTKDVSLVDAVNLCHPKATSALSKLMKGDLKAPETWEVGLTQAGQNAKNEDEKITAKAEVWRNLLENEKLGTFALLRNLRNIMVQAPDCIDMACKQLVNAEKIAKSLVLPFRFATAYKEIGNVVNISATIQNKVLRAIEKALEVSSVANVPRFEGETLVVLDVSRSMRGKSVEIGSLFSVILAKSNDADFMTFDEDARYKGIDPNSGFLTCQRKIIDQANGGSTNFHSIFLKANKKYDRIIILSDMQGWVGYNRPAAEFNAYKRKYNANPYIYSFDLDGYGDMQFPENQVYCIVGFSDKIFDLMKVLEQDRNALIKTIEKVEI